MIHKPISPKFVKILLYKLIPDLYLIIKPIFKENRVFYLVFLLNSVLEDEKKLLIRILYEIYEYAFHLYLEKLVV